MIVILITTNSHAQTRFRYRSILLIVLNCFPLLQHQVSIKCSRFSHSISTSWRFSLVSLPRFFSFSYKHFGVFLYIPLYSCFPLILVCIVFLYILLLFLFDLLNRCMMEHIAYALFWRFFCSFLIHVLILHFRRYVDCLSPFLLYTSSFPNFHFTHIYTYIQLLS